MAAFLIEIGERPAVGDNESLVTPFAAQDVADQIRGSGAGNPAEAVVGRHHFLDARLGHQILESGKIGLAQIALAHLGIEAMAGAFRPGMHGKVLGTGVRLQHFGIGIALEAPHDRHTELAGQVRIFAVGFHSAAPARVAENVDIGRPEGKPLVLALLARFPGEPVLDPGFVGDGREHGLDLVGVERGGHTDGLREHRGAAVAAHAVERLVPPVVGGNAQTRDGGGIEFDKGHLLFQGQLRQQIGRAYLGGQRLVEIGYFLGRIAGRQTGQQHQEQRDSFHRYSVIV